MLCATKGCKKWVGLAIESLHRVCYASIGGSLVKCELFLSPCTQFQTSKCDPNLVLTSKCDPNLVDFTSFATSFLILTHIVLDT